MISSPANLARPLGNAEQAFTMNPRTSDRDFDREFLKAAVRSRFEIETDVEFNEIEGELEFIELRSGEMLFEENDASSDVYIVLSGRLRAVRRRPNSEFEVLGEIGRGESVGELAFLSDTRRSASVVAVRESRLACFSRHAFERLLARQPRLATSTMRLVIERFRQQQQMQVQRSRVVSIAVVKISPSVDLLAFQAALATARREFGAPVTVLTAGEVNERTQRTPDRFGRDGAVTTLVNELEARSEALFLVADEAPSPWTERCIQAADEILLLGCTDDAPDISRIEAEILDRADPLPLARQTLVLFHSRARASGWAAARWLDRREVNRHFHLREGEARDLRRLARVLAGRAVGLVLSGGAARGLTQIGVMMALAEAGIDPDFIGGASMGAIIAACEAMDVRGLALAAAGRKAFNARLTSDFNALPIIALIKGQRAERGIRAAIEDAMGSDTINTEDTWKPYFCIASNYSLRREAVLRRGPLWRNTMASAAIPGVFPPQIIDGYLMFDGSTFNNFPVDVMAQTGADAIIGVDMLNPKIHTYAFDRIPHSHQLLIDWLKPRKYRKYRLPTLPETLLAATFVTAEAKQHTMQVNVALHLRPRINGVGPLDWKRYDDLVRAGYDYTIRTLAQLPAKELARFV
jgi:NTE family protein